MHVPIFNGLRVLVVDGHHENRLAVGNNPAIRRVPDSWRVYIKHNDNEALVDPRAGTVTLTSRGREALKRCVPVRPKRGVE